MPEAVRDPVLGALDRAFEFAAPGLRFFQSRFLKVPQRKALRNLKHFTLAGLCATRFAFSESRAFQYFPEMPSHHHAFRLVALAARCRGGPYIGAKKPPVFCFFHDDTQSPAVFRETLEKANPDAYIINGRCLDISKRHVDILHRDVFGYGLILDEEALERSTDEKFAIKPDSNAKNEGRVATKDEARDALCDDALVVQKLVDTRIVRDGLRWVCDLRVGIGAGRILFVIRKLRTEENVMFAQTAHFDLARPEDVFSKEETDLILRLCETSGLDIGELDILRDRTDGRLYVCDISRTPERMPYFMVSSKVYYCYAQYARAFRELVENVRGKA